MNALSSRKQPLVKNPDAMYTNFWLKNDYKLYVFITLCLYDVTGDYECEFRFMTIIFT